MNTACMQVALRARIFTGEEGRSLVLGDRSSIGSSVCFQRQPRNIWAKMPKGKLSSIHVQSISSVSTWLMIERSSPRYIHQRIAPPKTKGRTIFMMLLNSVFCSIGAKIQTFSQTKEQISVFLEIIYFINSRMPEVQDCQDRRQSRCRLCCLRGCQRVVHGHPVRQRHRRWQLVLDFCRR